VNKATFGILVKICQRSQVPTIVNYCVHLCATASVLMSIVGPNKRGNNYFGQRNKKVQCSSFLKRKTCLKNVHGLY
jgi:hypothetical protein